MSRRPTRYTRRILQAEADRWVGKLREMGYRLSQAPITVFTSMAEFETASAVPVARIKRCKGMAGTTSDGLPIVFVSLRHPRIVQPVDPLQTLIHELLHHVEPGLSHDEIYALADTYRRSDHESLVLEPAWDIGSHLDSGDGAVGLIAAERRDQEIAGLEALDRMWLEVNGLTRTPPRSPITGRFISMRKR